MSVSLLRYPASAIAGRHRFTADDIVLLRRHMFPLGLTSADDALQLLALHRSPAQKCAAWNTWFVEMMTAFIVVQSYPQNSIDELNARWLIDILSTGGATQNAAELEVILHAMEMADAVPDSLSAFALDQLRMAIRHGRGGYAEKRAVRRSGIAAEDIEYVYRILRGSLFAGKMLLSRKEVAVIDRIDAFVSGRINHTAWNDLVRSIADRTPEGHASAQPWLQMRVDDAALDDVA